MILPNAGKRVPGVKCHQYRKSAYAGEDGGTKSLPEAYFCEMYSTHAALSASVRLSSWMTGAAPMGCKALNSGGARRGERL